MRSVHGGNLSGSCWRRNFLAANFCTSNALRRCAKKERSANRTIPGGNRGRNNSASICELAVLGKGPQDLRAQKSKLAFGRAAGDHAETEIDPADWRLSAGTRGARWRGLCGWLAAHLTVSSSALP